jgi:hypothetical protein
LHSLSQAVQQGELAAESGCNYHHYQHQHSKLTQCPFLYRLVWTTKALKAGMT